jgi:hypothetical protein
MAAHRVCGFGDKMIIQHNSVITTAGVVFPGVVDDVPGFVNTESVERGLSVIAETADSLAVVKPRSRQMVHRLVGIQETRLSSAVSEGSWKPLVGEGAAVKF